MALSPVSEVLSNSPALKPISDCKSPEPLHFDPSEFFSTPPSYNYEGVLKKGSHVLNLTVRGDFIETQKLISFKTTQDVFFTMIDQHMLFSLDQKCWQSFDEVFSWSIGLDLPINKEGALDQFSITIQMGKQHIVKKN